MRYQIISHLLDEARVEVVAKLQYEDHAMHLAQHLSQNTRRNVISHVVDTENCCVIGTFEPR